MSAPSRRREPCLETSISRKFQSALLLLLVSLATGTHAQQVTPSPGWVGAMPPGPDTRVRITEAYAKLIARDAYFWAWPLVNVYNRRLTYENVPEIMLAGPVPAAPVNHLGMLTNYIVPEERIVACP